MTARSSVDLDELVEHWTVLEDERALVSAKRGATRLGFALLLKFYTRHGRFPAGGAELPGAVVEFVAGQVGVSPAEVGSYEWAGRSIERHRAQIREHLGFESAASPTRSSSPRGSLSTSWSGNAVRSAFTRSCSRAV